MEFEAVLVSFKEIRRTTATVLAVFSCCRKLGSVGFEHAFAVPGAISMKVARSEP